MCLAVWSQGNINKIPCLQDKSFKRYRFFSITKECFGSHRIKIMRTKVWSLSTSTVLEELILHLEFNHLSHLYDSSFLLIVKGWVVQAIKLNCRYNICEESYWYVWYIYVKTRLFCITRLMVFLMDSFFQFHTTFCVICLF